MSAKILDDFLVLGQKTGKIQRIFGYDGSLMPFLTAFYILSLRNGKYIEAGIPNPTEDELALFYEYQSGEPSYSPEEIMGFFPYLDKKETLAKAMEVVLTKNQFPSPSVKKNAYIKLLCWLRCRYLNTIRLENPKIIFEGQVGKYESYLIDLFCALGAHIIIVDFQHPPKDARENDMIFPRYEKPLIHFIGAAKGKLEEEKRAKEAPVPPPPPPVHTPLHIPPRTASTGAPKSPVPPKAPTAPKAMGDRSFFVENNKEVQNEDVFGAVFRTRGSRDAVYAQLSGGKKENYEYELFAFYEACLKEGRPFLLVENDIPNPNVQEVERFRNQSELDKVAVMGLPKIELNHLATKAVQYVVSREPQQKQKNLLVCMQCWLSRYKEIFSKEGAVFILFHGHKYMDMVFLKVLSLLPVNVLLINPDKSRVPELLDENMLTVSYPESLNLAHYPQTPVLQKGDTVARTAQGELDTVLYGEESGFFRDRQFTKSQALALDSTYDEISILWQVEAKYRPHFKVENKIVYVPCLFAKVSGVPEGNRQRYPLIVKNLEGKQTRLAQSFGFAKLDLRSPYLQKSHLFWKNGRLDKEALARDKDYPYSYVSDEISDNILEKIEQLLLSNLIDEDMSKLPKIALAILLNLDRELLHTIQNMDYTKEIPKFIVLDLDESMPSVEDVIYLIFLHLMGFDVVIFTPTGYRNVEKYLKGNLLTEHKVGDYIYDMDKEAFAKGNQRNMDGFIGKLFGRS